jgi:hypothetical protein
MLLRERGKPPLASKLGEAPQESRLASERMLEAVGPATPDDTPEHRCGSVHHSGHVAACQYRSSVVTGDHRSCRSVAEKMTILRVRRQRRCLRGCL